MKVVSLKELSPDVRNVGTTIRTGSTERYSIFGDDTEDGLNFTLNRTVWLGDDKTNTTPRHHHAFQQIRWAEEGSVNYAPDQDISKGDLAYFPRGAWYGPQRRDQGVSLTLQFGFHGEKQHGSAFWNRYQAEAMKALQARGKFEGGLYLETDPVTGKVQEFDGVDALYREQYAMHTNKPFVVPAPGYEAPILMHPEAFDYFDAAPGVEIKHLGRFFDHPGMNADLRISMLRISSGGVYRLKEDRPQVGWTRDAGLKVQDKVYPKLTYLYAPQGEDLVIEAEGEVELYLIELPRLD